MKIGQKILLDFKTGKTATDLIKEGKNKTTVYRYWRLYSNYKELNEKLWDLIYNSA